MCVNSVCVCCACEGEKVCVCVFVVLLYTKDVSSGSGVGTSNIHIQSLTMPGAFVVFLSASRGSIVPLALLFCAVVAIPN